MKANELRIGNHIEIDQYPNDRAIVLIENGADIDGCIKLNPKPIPLTEKWLLNFGFEITNNFQTKDRFQTHKQDGIIWFEYGYIVIELKHVHQLQNLYFALTNEELTIKSE